MQSWVSHDGVSKDVHNPVDVYPKVLDVHSWVSHDGRRISELSDPVPQQLVHSTVNPGYGASFSDQMISTSCHEPSSTVILKSYESSKQNLDGVYPRVLDVHSWVSQDEVSDDAYPELLDVQSQVSQNGISHNAYPVLLDVQHQVSCETNREFSANTDLGSQCSDRPGLNVDAIVPVNNGLATPG